jgi:hypothetical protein
MSIFKTRLTDETKQTSETLEQAHNGLTKPSASLLASKSLRCIRERSDRR